MNAADEYKARSSAWNISPLGSRSVECWRMVDDALVVVFLVDFILKLRHFLFSQGY